MTENNLMGLVIYDFMSIQKTTTECVDLHTVFNEFISYCNHIRKLRQTTIRGYEAAFTNFCRLMPEVKYTKDVTSRYMNDFFIRLDTRERVVGKGDVRVGVKASTTMTYWSKLNVFFVWLVDNDYLEDNPLTNMRPAEPQYNDKKELKQKDIEKIVGAIDLHSKNSFMLKRDKALLYLLIYTGLRKGEVIGLRVMDVDLHNNILRVNGNTSKSKVNRQIPIHNTLALHLREYIKARNERKYKTEKFIVSTNKDSGLTEHGYKHWVDRLKKLSGVKFHLHQFRHSFACRLGRDDIGVYKLQQLMGHTDLRMTQRYVRSMGVEDLRDSVNRMSFENMV